MPTRYNIYQRDQFQNQQRNKSDYNIGIKNINKVYRILKIVNNKGRIQQAVAKCYYVKIKKVIEDKTYEIKVKKINHVLENMTEDDHFSQKGLWKLKKKLNGKDNARSSIINEKGVEVTSDEAIVKEYEKEFTNRLAHRKIDHSLRYQEITNSLANLLTEEFIQLMKLERPLKVVRQQVRTSFLQRYSCVVIRV